MHKPGNDIFTRRKNEAQEKNQADEAQFTWFGPVGAQDRFRFLVVREEGDDVSILPGEGRFKKGLRAWRWDAAEEGNHEVYLVLKTRHNRIDLRRVQV